MRWMLGSQHAFENMSPSIISSLCGVALIAHYFGYEEPYPRPNGRLLMDDIILLSSAILHCDTLALLAQEKG